MLVPVPSAAGQKPNEKLDPLRNQQRLSAKDSKETKETKEGGIGQGNRKADKNLQADRIRSNLTSSRLTGCLAKFTPGKKGKRGKKKKKSTNHKKGEDKNKNILNMQSLHHPVKTLRHTRNNLEDSREKKNSSLNNFSFV